ncbi:hypothetical protein AAY473_027770 [Plecturocebus cupreus]
MEGSKNEVLVAAINGPAVKMEEVAYRDSAVALQGALLLEEEPSPSVSSWESTAARQRLEKKQLDSPKAGEGGDTGTLADFGDKKSQAPDPFQSIIWGLR